MHPPQLAHRHQQIVPSLGPVRVSRFKEEDLSSRYQRPQGEPLSRSPFQTRWQTPQAFRCLGARSISPPIIRLEPLLTLGLSVGVSQKDFQPVPVVPDLPQGLSRTFHLGPNYEPH